MPRATFARGIALTRRDWQLLRHLDCHPFSTGQLLRLSRAFPQPFTHLRLLQRRLHRLTTAGLLHSWPLATTGASPYYFKLSREGYRLLYGPDAVLPGRRHFEPLAPNRHLHTLALGDLLARLFVAVRVAEVSVSRFARENAFRFEAAGLVWLPDCAFELTTPDGRPWRYAVELDNGTERVRSEKEVESLERKLRGYDAHQARYQALDPRRYVALFLTTRSSHRLLHIMEAASAVMANPRRTVFLFAELQSFLDHPDPLWGASLRDNRGRRRGLLPPSTRPATATCAATPRCVNLGLPAGRPASSPAQSAEVRAPRSHAKHPPNASGRCGEPCEASGDSGRAPPIVPGSGSPVDRPPATAGPTPSAPRTSGGAGNSHNHALQSPNAG